MYQSLQDFKNFLIERKLAPENQITFYANWVSKFIRFSNVIGDKPNHLKMQLFVDDLKSNPKLSDWQIAQAQTAIHVYLNQFRKDKSTQTSESTLSDQKGFADVKTTLGKIREALRIKHYSYSTERTYLEWFQRFHDYLTTVRKKDWASEGEQPGFAACITNNTSASTRPPRRFASPRQRETLSSAPPYSAG